jgi:hypothetical protein
MQNTSGNSTNSILSCRKNATRSWIQIQPLLSTSVGLLCGRIWNPAMALFFGSVFNLLVRDFQLIKINQ